MRERARTAVISDLSVDSAARTKRLLAEVGYVALKTVFDGKNAYEAALRLRPDAVITDAVMPRLDGAGLATRLVHTQLSIRPAVIVVAFEGLAPPIRRNPSVRVITKPIRADELREALQDTSVERRRITLRARTAFSTILDRLGVPEHPGREYLMEAAYLAYCDARLTSGLTKALYPMVAGRFLVTSSAVERAMRHVIEFAWANGSIEEQYGIFKGTIDAARGKPTCGGMIAQLAEMLRMEDGR